MKKSNLCRVVATLAALSLVMATAGCTGTRETPDPELINGGSSEVTGTSETVGTSETSETSEETGEDGDVKGRADGERFVQVITIEGMEEEVGYEHAIDETLGFEMDYEYEMLKRRTEVDFERFFSFYDDPTEPVNYLEITFEEGTEATVGAAITEELLKEYKVYVGSFDLSNGQSVTRLDASEAKEGGVMPENLQQVYIIPANGGCLVATAHFSIEAAEGFGTRFANMVRTLRVIEK